MTKVLDIFYQMWLDFLNFLFQFHSYPLIFEILLQQEKEIHPTVI